MEEPPFGDSLASINWMQRVLVAMASDVIKGNPDEQKRAEILKIADRMAKLRDQDRIHAVEQAMRELADKRDRKPKKAQTGPRLKSAAEFDAAAGAPDALYGEPK